MKALVIASTFFVLVLSTLPVEKCHAFSSAELDAELRKQIETQLQSRFVGAEIKLPSLEKICQQSPLSEVDRVQEVRITEDKPQGVLVVEVRGSSDSREIRQSFQTPYEAWVDVQVASRRIYPNTTLKKQDFRVQKINVSSGMPREFRGVLLKPEVDVSTLESRQTILEGHFLTESAVHQQPAVRKGEMVRLELMSGDMSLTTQAIVQEAAQVGQRVRVITLKTKKEMSGKVRPDHSIEVRL